MGIQRAVAEKLRATPIRFYVIAGLRNCWCSYRFRLFGVPSYEPNLLASDLLQIAIFPMTLRSYGVISPSENCIHTGSY